MRTLSFALALLLLVCVSSASCIENAGQMVMNGAGWFIALAAGLTIVVIAVAYMYGSAMSDAHATVFAKDELYHLGFSLVLVLGVGGIIASSCLFTNYMFHISNVENTFNACGGMDADPGTLSQCGVDNAIYEARSLSARFTTMNIYSMMSSNWAYTYAVPFSDVVTTVASAYMRTYAMQFETITNTFLIPILVTLSMQKLLVMMASKYAIEVILPLGFIFRLVPPMRRFGNFLLALAFGLYVVIPFFTAYNYFMMGEVSYMCGRYAPILYDTVLNNGVIPGDVSHGWWSSASSTCSTGNAFWSIAMLIPQAFFLPNLTIALFVTFLSAVNKALSVVG